MSQLNVITIHNPLDPRHSSRDAREFKLGQSMADLFPPAVLAPEMAYTLNAKVIAQSEFALHYPQPGDFVTICPVPEGGGGGGGGKTILRMVALIAITYFTAGWGATLTGEWGVLGGMGLSAGAVQAGITVAGAMLVNAMMPPPKPPDQASQSPTYGIDGPKNTSVEGVPIPVVYGKFRYGGNIVDNYVVNDTMPVHQGDGSVVTAQTQILYMLIACGEGPIASITDILINDQPPETYQNLELQILTGQPDQLPMPWFADTISPHSINLPLTDTGYVNYTTDVVVDQLRVDLSAPAGLVFVNNDGKNEQVSVPITIEYKLHSGSTWLPFPATNDLLGYTERTVWLQVPQVTTDLEGNPVFSGNVTYAPTGGEYRLGDTIYSSGTTLDGPSGPVVGQVVHDSNYTTAGNYVMQGADQTAMRRSLFSPRLTPGVYDVRIKRTTPHSLNPKIVDQVFVTDINDIILDDVGYRNVAMLGVKILLSDQLNGEPTVTHISGGKVITVWDAVNRIWKSEASANPAWIALDMLTNKRYGGGSSMSRIDMVRWKEWAQFCDDEGLTFNGVFDTNGNLWDSLQQVLRCGHAQLTTVGTRYSVVIEKADVPSQIFSVANMVAGSFKQTWLDMSGRANEVDGTFTDSADNWAQRSLKLYDKAALSRGAPPRTSSIDLKGITDAQRAWTEMQLLMNMTRKIRRTVQFSAPLEAIACTVGDVVLVQHDMPAWGVGGRVLQGCTNSILYFDRPVLMEPGKSYTVSIQFDTLLRYTDTVYSVAGTYVFLNNYTGATDVKRFKIRTLAKDFEILEFVNDGAGHHGVRIADPTGIAPGQTWELWDTNVIEAHPVLNSIDADIPLVTELDDWMVTENDDFMAAEGDPADGMTYAVTLATPLLQSPAQFTKFLFGEVTKVNKPFRVRAITGGSEYTRDIVAAEYDETVYDPADTSPPLNYSSLQIDTAVVQQAVIDKAFETLTLVGHVWQSSVTVSYSSPQQTYQKSDVFVSRNGSQFVFAGSDPSTVTVPAQKNDVLVFRIVAHDRSGRNAPVTKSPTVTYTVLGKTARPSDVTGLIVAATSDGVRISWDRPPDGDYASTALHDELGWSDSTAPLFQGDATSWTWVTAPVGTHTLLLKHFDTSGNESASAASITFTVSATGAVSYSTLAGRPKLFRAVSRGFADVNGPPFVGLLNGETNANLGAASRSYTLYRIARSDGSIVGYNTYDVYGNGANTSGRNAATLAADLNASTTSHIVVVVGYDEPATNRFTNGLDVAMYRCGASRGVWGSPQFKLNSAYVLIGIPGCGEGQGYESYSGSVDADVNAWCDVAFEVLSGNLIITGMGATPRTLADYSYTGDLNATSDLSLVASSGLTLTGNSAVKKTSSVAWDEQVYSRDGYTGGAFASALSPDLNTNVMFGLNTDPLTNASYLSIDYAFYLEASGVAYIYESGALVATLGARLATDVWAVTNDDNLIRYLKNGTVVRATAAPVGAKFFFDSSFYSPGARLTNVRFAPQSSNNWSNIGAVNVTTSQVGLNQITQPIFAYTTADQQNPHNTAENTLIVVGGLDPLGQAIEINAALDVKTTTPVGGTTYTIRIRVGADVIWATQWQQLAAGVAEQMLPVNILALGYSGLQAITVTVQSSSSASNEFFWLRAPNVNFPGTTITAKSLKR
jgi:predicted phage tail protein